MFTTDLTRDKIDEVVRDWPEKPRQTAERTMQKYGAPNEASESMLVWYENGPWQKTIVYRDEVPHKFPKPHTDLLEQFIDYRVPPEKFDDLARFDGSFEIVIANFQELDVVCRERGFEPVNGILFDLGVFLLVFGFSVGIVSFFARAGEAAGDTSQGDESP